jgi:hypothetical protein
MNYNNSHTKNMLHWLGRTVLLLFPLMSHSQLVSHGAWTSGSISSSSVNHSSGAGFSNGFSTANSISTPYLSGSGFVAVVLNPPHFTDLTGNIVAESGASVEVTFDDLVALTSAVDVDGDALVFHVIASNGELSQGGAVVAEAVVAQGESFDWSTPLESEDPDPYLTVTASDEWIFSETSVEVDAITTLEASLAVDTESGSVSESSSLDYGDAEVGASSNDQTYTISNTESANLLLVAEAGSVLGSRSLALGSRNFSRVVASLVISEIKIGGANPDDFVVSGVQLPFTLGPGESTTFVVSFAPGRAGDSRAEVEVFRQGSQRRLFGFGVKGRGNRPPTGGNDDIYRRPGLAPFRISLADLLANDSDIDGDPVSFGGFSTETSKNGRVLLYEGDTNTILYFPGEADETPDDSFVYRVSDGRGATAPSVVWIRDAAILGPGAGLRLRSVLNRNGATELSVIGEEGHRYQFQYTEEFPEPRPSWTNLGTAVLAVENGALLRFIVEDLSSERRFFRVLDLPPTGPVGPPDPPGPQP